MMVGDLVTVQGLRKTAVCLLALWHGSASGGRALVGGRQRSQRNLCKRITSETRLHR